MPYTVALPDGRVVEFPDNVPKERAAEILREQFPTPSAGFSLRDLFTSFGQGAVGSTKALTDVAGAGNAASQQLEQAGEALQSRLTPERQAELERQQARAKKAAESGSTWEEIKAAAQSVAEAPLQSAAQALGSFVPYLPTLFLGPGAAALGLGARATAAATQVARAAPAAIGTAQGAGAVKGAIYERVYEAERKDGVPEEQARAKAVAAQDYFGRNIDQILLGGGAGFVAGKFGAEKLLTPGAAAAAERSMLGRVGTALATDVPTEAFQGGQEQLAANLALQRTGRDVPTFQGVAAQATQEGLMGALGSAPVAAIQGPGAALAREEQARRAEEIAQRQAAIDAEAAQRTAFRQSPQYLDDLEQRFAQLKETERKLNEATKGKVDKNDPLAVERQRRAKEALAEFKKSDEYTNLVEEFTAAYDQLAPRAQERARVAEEEQRVARVGAAPEGAQLDVFGEPAGVQDRSVPGQIKSLEQYISSFDKQIKAAQSAGDQNQVALLQQKQNEARQQIAALFPDAALLSETKQRAQTRLEEYQTKIKELTQAIAGNPNAEEIAALQAELSQLNAQLAQVPQMAGLVAPAARERTQQRLQAQLSEQIAKVQARIAALQTTPNKTAEQYRQLRQLNESASQIRSAIAEIDRTQATAEKYRPSEVLKPVDKTKRLADLTKKLEKQSELGEDITQTLAQIEEAQGLQEQPSLFGEEDLRPVETRDLGDLIAEERKQIQDLQKMALMFAEQARQAQAQRGVVRSTKQELLEEARQKVIEVRRRNQTLVDIDRLQGLVQQLSAQVTTLQTQNKPVPDALTKRIATIRKDLDTLMSTVKAAQQKPEPVQSRTVLPEGDGRVTDAELTAQRDRDIEGLLDQYLAPALGVTETQETLTAQGPEGERQIRLTTLGSDKYEALSQELEGVNARRTDAVIDLFKAKGATANMLRSEIVMLVTREVELQRQLDKLAPLSAEYRQDLQSLLRQAFTPPSAIPKNRTPNLAERQYLDAVNELKQVTDETLDAIYAMNKLAYKTRTKGIEGTTSRSWHFALGEGPEISKLGSVADLVQNDPVMKAGLAAQARVSAAQKRVDAAAKNMPQLPDLTGTMLEDRIDNLAAEFAEGTPKELAKLSKDRRVATGNRPAALEGADVGARIAYNENQIKQIRQDLKYAGRPTDPEKVAARDRLVAELQPLLAENKALRERYNRQQSGEAASEMKASYQDRLNNLEKQVAALKEQDKDVPAKLTQRIAELRIALQTGQEKQSYTPRPETDLRPQRGAQPRFSDVAPEEAESSEVTEMRQELAGIERALASGMFKGDAVQRLEAARDALQARLADAAPEMGPPTPTAEDRTSLLPGMSQRFAQFEYRPVAPEALAKAKTDFVKATQKIEDIRSALGRLDEMGPKYFQEVATTYQQNIDNENKERKRLEGKILRAEASLETAINAQANLPEAQRETAPIRLERLGQVRETSIADLRKRVEDAKAELAVSERRSKELEQAEAEVKRFLNLAKLAGTSSAQDLRPSLERARDEALADKDRKEAAVKDLEKRQRMYEQQEAAKSGVDLGDIEAERIAAGETKGFLSGRGKALAEKPKSKRSWVVSTDSKAKIMSPGQAGNLAAATQNALALLEQAKVETKTAEEALATAPTPEQLRVGAIPLQYELRALEMRIAESYSPEQAATIAAEIQKLRERLAAVTPAPKIADVATAYAQANKPKKGEPAYLRVGRLKGKTAYTALKAASELRTAEQNVAAQEKKYEDLKKTYKQAEKRLSKLKDVKKRQGVQLQMSNLYALADKLRDNIADAIRARSVAENNYMVAQLESLLLEQQVGENAKTAAADLTARLADAANTVTTLTKERDAALDRENKIRSKLTAAEAAAEKAKTDAKNAREAALNAERAATEKARNDALDAAATARQQAARAQSGLGLPGRRIERSTAGQLMTAAQADIKQRLATAETNLSKAMRSGNTADIKAATAKVQEITLELDQIYSKAPVTTTELEGAESAQPRLDFSTLITNRLAMEAALERAKASKDATAIASAEQNLATVVEQLNDNYPAQKIIEGMRLAASKQGPSVRYVRGGNKAIMQSGAVKLRAAGLSQEAANAISLYVAKNRIAGAKKAETKEQYQKDFANLTNGMTDDQVSAMLAEGKRLMGLGPTAELIAKRTAYQDALAAVTKAEQDVKNAKTNVTKELATDALEEAQTNLERRSNAYDQAKALYEASQVKRAKTAEKETVESFFNEPEEVAPSRTATAIESSEDLVPMVYTTATRTESNAAVREAILDGRLLDALDRLAVEGANDLIKQSARELREFVLRTKVRIDPNLKADGKDVPAAFNPSSNTIFFRPNEITDEDIIHEVTHAATMRVMRMPDNQLTDRQRNAKKEIEALFAKLKKDSALAGEYGLENAEEFVSEVQSNVEFRAAIDKMPWYKRLWHAIVRLFSDAPIESVSERASRMVRELYLPSAKIAAPTGLVPSVFRGAQPSEFTMVGRPAGAMKTLTGNLFGLAGRVQYIDRLAAAERAFVEAQKAGNLSSLEAENAQYFMRLGDMTTQAAGQFITNGPVRIVKDNLAGNVEERYESQTGATLLQVSEFIERAAAAGLGSAKAVEDMLTVKIAGDRANAIPRGWERLFSENPSKAKAEYDTVMARINGNPEAKKFIDAATAEYKEYNNGLMDFAEQTGFLSAAEAKRLKKSPYIPYYRVENGEVKLFVDRETPLVIGNIKNNPDLQQLLGDNTQILPLLTSAVQNTFMLTRMGLRNKATQETASALEKSGFVTKMGKGYGPEGVNTVRYKYKGEPYFATVDSDQFGIPAELIVKGMEGIKTTIPDIVRLLGIPANWLRTFITRSPAYVLRQLVRDPLNAAITGGVDGVPVLNAFKQLAKMKAGRNSSADALMRGLTVSSNIFTGNEEDMQRFLEAASTGRGKWAKLMGTFDQLALESDAATRTAIYEDSLRKGFSERQAQFRAMEAQNFSRRGLSPSTQVLSTLVPFFNAQIQGLDVLYRSFSGQMPFSERLGIQKKIIARGTLLMVTALSYAFLMRDNEEYKKATPEERYSSFFVPLPGVKEMFRIPIPYEVGLLFKALPEALLDSILGDTKAVEAAKGIGMLLLQSAPGVIPAAGKPLIEAAYGTTTFGPIESQREKMLPTEQRYRETTPEVLKTLGSYTGAVGISPLMLEHLARGYTSTLGISMLRMLDPVLGSAMEGEKASTPLSKMPFIGGLFQTGDGRFLIERAYSRMEEINQAVAGYKDLESRGRRAEAQAFAQRNSDLLAAADMAGMFRQRSGQMFSDERAVRSDPSLSRAQKDALLEKIKAAQQEEARQFYAASERTTRQPPRP